MKTLTRLMIGAMFVAGLTVLGADGALGKFTDFAQWKAGPGTTIEKSTEYKTTGESCAKVTIGTTNKYPGLLLENKGVFNLNDTPTMTFDCFNPGGDLKFILKLKSAGKKWSKVVMVPKGQNKVKISLEGAGVDLSAIRYIKLWTKKPSQEIVLFMDNLVFE